MAREPRQQNTIIHVIALESQIWLKYLDRRSPYIRFCVEYCVGINVARR